MDKALAENIGELGFVHLHINQVVYGSSGTFGWKCFS